MEVRVSFMLRPHSLQGQTPGSRCVQDSAFSRDDLDVMVKKIIYASARNRNPVLGWKQS
jgi:hypothetical protein